MDQALPLDTSGDDPNRALLLDDLARLRGIGMGMAETIGRLTDTVAAVEETKDAVEECGVLSLAFSRVARGVRQVVAIEHELMGEGDLGHLPDKVRARRNAETAEALRLRVGGIVRNRVPQIDREYLKGLLSDLFSDYDDYGDVDLVDIKPLIARVCDRMSLDYNPELWPESANGIRIGDDLLDPNERDDELDRRIADEIARLAAPDPEDWADTEAATKDAARGWYGHDPP